MPDSPLSGLEKAAVLLTSLPPAIVEKVLAHLEPKEATRLSAELGKVARRPDLKETAARVLEEAVGVLSADIPQPRSGAQDPRGNQVNAGRSSVDIRLTDPVSKDDKEPDAAADPLAAVAALSPELLTRALDDENARTISLLMNRLDGEAAGQIYKRLSGPKRKEVSLRFTDPTTITEELLRHIACAVLKKCQALASTSGASNNEQAERERRMAGLLRSLDRAERVETLTALEESNSELAGRIKAMLYLFEDILRMENSSIQKLLSEIDMKALAAALFGAAQEIQDRILANLSKRAQESLKEEIELTGKVPTAKVKQARQTLEEAMQRLDQSGALVMME